MLRSTGAIRGEGETSLAAVTSHPVGTRRLMKLIRPRDALPPRQARVGETSTGLRVREARSGPGPAAISVCRSTTAQAAPDQRNGTTDGTKKKGTQRSVTLKSTPCQRRLSPGATVLPFGRVNLMMKWQVLGSGYASGCK